MAPIGPRELRRGPRAAHAAGGPFLESKPGSVLQSVKVYGHGCSMALVQAAMLDEAIGRHPTDVHAMTRRLHRESEAELRPFWDVAAAGDRRVLEPGLPSLTDPGALLFWLAGQAFGFFLERGLVPATRVDSVVFRGLLRTFHMLESPEKLFTDPGLLLRSLPVLVQVLHGNAPQDTFPRVSRAAVLAAMDQPGG